MPIDIDEKNLKHGVLGLVLALVEIIRDALELQAMNRIDAGELTPEETERLGDAFLQLDTAIRQIKLDQGVSEAVAAVRDGLDDLVDDAVHAVLAPQVTALVGIAENWERSGDLEPGLCGADASLGG